MITTNYIIENNYFFYILFPILMKCIGIRRNSSPIDIFYFDHPSYI
jgi:hypothetical protein